MSIKFSRQVRFYLLGEASDWSGFIVSDSLGAREIRSD